MQKRLPGADLRAWFATDSPGKRRQQDHVRRYIAPEKSHEPGLRDGGAVFCAYPPAIARGS